MTFGDRIRHERGVRHLSLDELATRARIPWATLADIENNRHYPRIAELQRLLDALGTSLAELQARPVHWVHDR